MWSRTEGPLRTLQADPVLFSLLGEYKPSRELWGRLFAVLVGRDAAPGALTDRERIQVSVLAAALGSVAYPLTIDIEDRVLRGELGGLVRRILPSGTERGS